MSRWIVILATALALFSACTSGEPSDPRTAPTSTPAQRVPGEAEIREAFDAYVQALRDEDPAAAVALLSEGTLEHFDDIRRLAISATKKELAEERLIDRFSAIVMRYLLPPDRLEELKRRETAAFAVQTSLIGKAASVGQVLGDLRSESGEVVGQLVIEGVPSDFLYTFVEEERGWTINILAALADADRSFTSIAADSALAEDEFILSAIENVVGQKPPDSIWEPPR